MDNTQNNINTVCKTTILQYWGYKPGTNGKYLIYSNEFFINQSDVWENVFRIFSISQGTYILIYLCCLLYWKFVQKQIEAPTLGRIKLWYFHQNIVGTEMKNPVRKRRILENPPSDLESMNVLHYTQTVNLLAFADI